MGMRIEDCDREKSNSTRASKCNDDSNKHGMDEMRKLMHKYELADTCDV